MLSNHLGAPLLIAGFPMVQRAGQAAPPFGTSQHDKQTNNLPKYCD